MIDPPETISPELKARVDAMAERLMIICKRMYGPRWAEHLADAYFMALRRANYDTMFWKYLPADLRKKGRGERKMFACERLGETFVARAEDDPIESTDEIRNLHKQIDALPGKCRDVMRLVARGCDIRRDGSPEPETNIAAILGLNKSTASKLRQQGMQLLRSAMVA